MKHIILSNTSVQYHGVLYNVASDALLQKGEIILLLTTQRQHTTLTRDKHPQSRRDETRNPSKPSGQTARRLG
jgi:hypothetical protein